MKSQNTKLLNYTFFALQLFICLGYLLKGKYTAIFSPVVSIAIFLGIIALETFSFYKLNNYIRFCLVLTLISHNLIGEFFNVYLTNFVFDKVLHFFGTFSFTLLVYSIFNTYITNFTSKAKLVTFLLAVFIGTSLGALFEICEFLVDSFSNNHTQNGLVDTDLDLVFDFVGSIVAGYILTRADVRSSLDFKQLS